MARPDRRVLIVDDDATIGLIVGQMLRGLDYAPQQVQTPAKALTLLRGEPFLFVVCDVMMPGMNGPELIRAAAREREDLRVLFVSGYPMDELRATPIPGVTHRCLDKPFSLSQFARAVHDLLTSADVVRPGPRAVG